MYAQWIVYGRDPENKDELATAFYRPPIWVLNGLFIELHSQSLEDRRVFTDWVTKRTSVELSAGLAGSI